MRVLVVEDEAKLAAFVRAGLEEHGYAVEVCGDGETALARAATGGFDALVLDIMLPGRDGREVLRALRAAQNRVPVILLTARGGLEDRIEGLNLGADDYLAKPFAMLELVARLGAVLRRHHGDRPPRVSVADLAFDPASREVRRAGTRIELTPRELALLECLLQTPGRVVTRAELSRTVWGYTFDPGTNFVDVAVQRLRRKLDDPFPQKLLQTVRGVGYAIQAGP
jgi:two-component system copper resistance phosphate regulon response regulator CusR